MPAIASPFGFRVAKSPMGIIRPNALPGGIASSYGSNIFSGMPVILDTNGTLIAGTAAADLAGIFAGCEYDPANGGSRVYSSMWAGGSTYIAGSMVAYFYRDPTLVYEVQSAATLAATAVGDQADVSNVGNGNTSAGLSTCTLGALVGNGVQGQFSVVELAQYPDNNWGDNFVTVRVQLARSQFVANKVAV